MLLNKIVIIGILLISIPNISGWDDETPLADNETLNNNFNPYINQSSINAPNVINSLDDTSMQMPFLSPTYISNDLITVGMDYTLYKMVWDGTSYVAADNCVITIEEEVTLAHNAGTNQYEIPQYWKVICNNEILIKQYFQDLINSNVAYCKEINNTGEIDNADILVTGININTGDGSIFIGNTYTQITDSLENELGGGDIGYSETGKGKGAGSSAIYQGINLYGGIGDNQDMKGGFDNFFFMLIPLIFIIAVMRFAGRILK